MTRLIAAVPALLLATTPALAHIDAVAHLARSAEVDHSMFGADHLLAMLAGGVLAFAIMRLPKLMSGLMRRLRHAS